MVGIEKFITETGKERGKEILRLLSTRGRRCHRRVRGGRETVEGGKERGTT